MAPELLAGQPPTIKADIYALGVLLFQIVIGDLGRPIAHGWEREIEDEVLRDDIAACVAGKPDDRLPAASALSLRLRKIGQQRERRRSERRRRMFLRASSMLAVVFLLLSGAAGIGLWQVDRARRAAVAAEARAAKEAAKAERQAAIAQAVNDFLRKDLLGAANPRNTPNREITVREVLDAAAEKISGKFENEPLVEAATRWFPRQPRSRCREPEPRRRGRQEAAAEDIDSSSLPTGSATAAVAGEHGEHADEENDHHKGSAGGDTHHD